VEFKCEIEALMQEGTCQNRRAGGGGGRDLRSQNLIKFESSYYYFHLNDLVLA